MKDWEWGNSSCRFMFVVVSKSTYLINSKLVWFYMISQPYFMVPCQKKGRNKNLYLIDQITVQSLKSKSVIYTWWKGTRILKQRHFKIVIWNFRFLFILPHMKAVYAIRTEVLNLFWMLSILIMSFEKQHVSQSNIVINCSVTQYS